MTEAEALAILKDYSDGRRGTRSTIEALSFRDYADLIIALAQADLPFPGPVDSPALAEHRARAREILAPLLAKDATTIA